MIRRWYERAVVLAGALGTRLASVRVLIIAAALVPTLAAPVLAQGERYFRGGPFGPWMWFAGAAMLLRALLIVALIVVVWRLVAARGGVLHPPDSALQILRERYAKGEISDDEYRKRLATLT